jgi:catechol 2,3-dioxygenase
VPTGHRIELFAEMALSDDGPMTRNPEIWRDEPHGTDIPGVVKFFTEVLDFSLTEAAETPDGCHGGFP